MAAVIVAAVLNNGFFSAPASPAAMITAGGLTLGALAAVAGAKALVDSYFQCAGAPPGCAGALSNLLSALVALMTVLSIQATACFVAAGIAWIPWAGAAPMYVLIATFIIQLALIPTIIAFSVTLVDCVKNATTPAPPSSSGAALTAAAGVIVLTVIGAVARGVIKRRKTRWASAAPAVEQ
jgi:hypothetical protein